jgi:hypothetical protein
MKKVFEALEVLDGGKEIIVMLKEELSVYNDLDAKSRLSEKKIDKLQREIADLEKIKATLDEHEINLDDIPNLKNSGKEKTDVEKTLSKVMKQMETMQKTIDIERAEKETISKQAKTQKLHSEISSELSGIFKKSFASNLTDNLIAKGSVKYDDAGTIVFEMNDGIYSKAQAIDILKKDYEDQIAPTGKGSGMNPPKAGTNYGMGQVDTSKMSSRELFEIGLKGGV